MGSEIKDILGKISSYNLFNYLFTGIVFVIVASKVSRYSFIQQDVVLGLFLYYFIGLVVSRFGSLMVEPILKGLSFVKFADYEDFVAASKKDEKIDVLSEANNTYRTLCAAFILLIFVKLYENIEARLPALKDWNAVVVLGLLAVIFLFSYRKQTQYVTKRVEINKVMP